MVFTKDITSDWVKFGTMFLVAQWLSGGSLSDRGWQSASLYTLLGFTVYHLSTRTVLTPLVETEIGQAIANDWVKVGTMLIVSRLLSGGSMTDTTWIRASLATLVGFTIYHIVVSRYVQGSDLSDDTKMQNVVNDWAKVGTMLFVSRVLSCQSMTDPRWVMSALGTLVGFTVYDLGTSRLVDALFD